MPKKKRKEYAPIEVLQRLEEIANPDFARQPNRGKYARLLEMVRKHPNRWFVVSRFPICNRGTDEYGYLKPYLTLSRLSKRYKREGFEFKMFKENEQTKTVLVRYPESRYAKARRESSNTKKVGAQ